MPNSNCFSLHNAAKLSYPILLSVPHAGRDYPPELIEKLRVSPAELVRLEDRYADRLVQHAIAMGFTAIIAHRARAWIDLNRSEKDMDSEMLQNPPPGQFSPGPKTRGGLGLIPRRLSGCGELWRSRLTMAEFDQRLENAYRPYHSEVEKILSTMQAQFGLAILIDVHSMPALSQSYHSTNAQIVIGDRFAQSAAPLYSETAAMTVQQHGLAVTLNHPYPGDYILRRHGRPRHNVHAIQIEIERSLYLDELHREIGGGLAKIQTLVADIAGALIDQCGWALPIAAE
jgi:N-formylglutamate amidohydrolase